MLLEFCNAFLDVIRLWPRTDLQRARHTISHDPIVSSYSMHGYW